MILNQKQRLKLGNDCAICCETYTKQARKPIECPACDFAACKACVQTYLLQIKTPKCMKCNVEWDDAFLMKTLGGFMNTKHRKYTKDLLFDMEKARFPETMPAVENVIQLEKLTVLSIEYDEKMEALRRQMHNLRNEKDAVLSSINDIKYGKKKKDSVKKFIRACPANDCNGFLSTSYKCGVCSKFTCPKCFELIGDKPVQHTDHVCNEDTLKTAEMLRKETKPCPSCSAAIYKISGCDQMWCTQCKVPFSWKTGLKVTGVIHNPHYYQWMKEGGNLQHQPGAEICGGLPMLSGWRSMLQKLKFDGIDDILSRTFIMRNTYLRKLAEPIITSAGHSQDYNPLDYVYTIKDGDKPIAIRTRGNTTYPIPEKYVKVLSKKEIEEKAERLEYDSDRVNPYVLITPQKFIDANLFLQRIHNILQYMGHFQDIELNRYRERCQLQQENQDLRIKFIMKKIDEKKMKTQLITRERKFKKENRILQIYELFNQVGGECMRDMYNTKTLINCIENYNKIERVRKYCNDELLKISDMYDQVVPCINARFRSEGLNYRSIVKRSTKDGYDLYAKKISAESYIDSRLGNRKIINDVFKNILNHRFDDEDIKLLNAYIDGSSYRRQSNGTRGYGRGRF